MTFNQHNCHPHCGIAVVYYAAGIAVEAFFCAGLLRLKPLSAVRTEFVSHRDP